MRSDRATTLRIPPDGCMDIIGGDVVGSLSSVLYARLDAGDEAKGIRLRPGAFTALYGVPADELADLRLPLADVVRPRALLAAVRDADRPDPLAAAAMLQPDVRGLARESGYSERHLRRRILATTGHSPRKLARIARMQALFAAGRGESWARTAVELGFYDESHMINDIRALTGATPQTILEEATSRPGARRS
jgi:AraC-like DNA-binding protein